MKRILSLLLVAAMLVTAFMFSSCDKADAPEENVEETNTPVESETPDEPESPAEAPAESEAPAEAPAEPEAPAEAPAEVSAADLVNGAIKNTLGAGSYEAKIYKSLDTDLMGNKTSSWLDVVAKASGTSASVEGKKLEYEYESEHKYYYDGSWMYYDMYDSKFKEQVAPEQFAAVAGGITGVITELPAEAFANATVTDNTVELAIDEATTKTLYRATIVNIMYDILGEYIDPVVVQNAKIKVTVENGFVKAYNLSFDLEYVIGNDRVAYNFKQDIEFANPGQPVTVNMPANLGDYMEMEWG